ncbi:hypothetical protein Dimus_001386 [Dionaea muscipula]
MGIEVLHPRDILMERIRVAPTTSAVFPRRRSFNTNNHHSMNRMPKLAIQKMRVNSGFKSISVASISGRPSSEDVRSAAKHLVIGKVRILRRRESLEPEKVKSEEASTNMKEVHGGTIMISSASDLEMFQTRICIMDPTSPPPPPPPLPKTHLSPVKVYAGSAAFAVSPSPESLPLPSFSRKNKKHMSMIVDDFATRELRRLLRLD